MAKECKLSTGKLHPGGIPRNSVVRITDYPNGLSCLPCIQGNESNKQNNFISYIAVIEMLLLPIIRIPLFVFYLSPFLQQDRKMSSYRHKTDDLKHLVDLFRLIVTKDPSALKAVNKTLHKEPSRHGHSCLPCTKSKKSNKNLQKESELLARQLTFTCGSIFDFADTGCACVLDHENFRYITEDTVDEKVLDKISQSILCGQCEHHDSLPEEDEETVGPLPTSVTLAHVAAVVGNAPVLKILLQLVGKQSPLTEQLRSSPLHLAILHNRQLCVRTIIESQTIVLKTYCGLFSHERQNMNRPNSIDCDYMSTFELCVRMNNFEALKQILQRTPFQASWIIDALKSKSDDVYEIVSQYINTETLSKFQEDDANAIHVLYHGISKGKIGLVERLITARGKGQYEYSPVLLAVVYDQPKILEYLIMSNVCNKDINIKGFTLMDISDSLNHVECSSILSNHGMNLTQRRSENPLRVMLEIGRLLRLGQYTDSLIEKVGLKGEFEDIPKWSETLTFISFQEFGGLGVRKLLSLCRYIDVKGPDGLSPLALALKHHNDPHLILDVLYFNPCLNQFEQDGMRRTRTEKHLQLFDRSEVKAVSMLALAIERDLKNYAVRKWALCYSGFRIYEGSMAVLLLDCGYDIRADALIHSSYPNLLEKRSQSGREDEIRDRIKHRIDRELYFPKPLKERCRDVLRRHFTGHSLYRYVVSANTPPSVRDFVLMDSRLNLRPQNGTVLSIEED